MTETLVRPRPDVHAMPGLPGVVRIYEVGPRDGLQAEPDRLPTAIKIELSRRLLSAGVPALEVTSFVPPAWVPQLADAADVFPAVAAGAAGVPGAAGAAEADAASSGRATGPARLTAFVPNLRGLEAAKDSGATEVSLMASATDAFARANLNTTADGSLDSARGLIRAGRAEGLATRAYVSMAFGDPWQGHVPMDTVAGIAADLFRAGAGTVALGDTIGVATPGHVRALIEACLRAGVPVDRLALHLHDTYGQGLANVMAGLGAGVTEFDTSVGGLGRCPYAPGATGNLATEDLVWLLAGLGIETGVDLAGLVDTTEWLSTVLGRPLPSRVATALNAAMKAKEQA